MKKQRTNAVSLIAKKKQHKRPSEEKQTVLTTMQAKLDNLVRAEQLSMYKEVLLMEQGRGSVDGPALDFPKLSEETVRYLCQRLNVATPQSA